MSSTTGRKRVTERHYSAEEQALDQISKEAEARIQARRAARAEAREIRLREIAKQQKEEEERLKTQEADSGKSLSSYSGSRRGSDESTSTDTDLRDKDPKDAVRQYKSMLRDYEEKYKKAMSTNAQLDNQKHTLVYQVELLKDQLEEQEESMIEVQRQYKDKCREFENQKRSFIDLEFQYNGLKEQMSYRDRFLQESGFTVVSTEEGMLKLEKCSTMTNGPIIPQGSLLVSDEAAEMLAKAGEGSLDDKLRKFLEEKKRLLEEIKSLQKDIEDERSKKDKSPKVPQMNGPEMQLYEVQREASKQIHEYKLKLQKAEQDIGTYEATVNRLEQQIKRYKFDAEEAEKTEDELKTEKRRLQRELRDSQNQVEELQNQNKHLKKRLEKVKQTRSALLNFNE
ncbi:hypothetical protein ACJMK2_024319 [Sinanodonta woodiana]|uniref:Leucine-rich repeat flightless-interacting protein 2 n=1 Tax=Sinanodonta woodiana TaxID=1069815 RepID=A0ABD3T700_SINWO